MINTKPSRAVEKAWFERITEFGCVITGQSNIDRHHSVGREWKQNKFYIGRWFVLPLAKHLHEIKSPHNLNITHHRKAFIAEYGLESELFKKMCRKLAEDGPLPFGEDVIAAIMATGR